MTEPTRPERIARALAAALDQDLAGDVAVALRQHARHLATAGDEPAAGFDELLGEVTRRAMQGQAGPKFALRFAAADAEPHDLHTYDEAAHRLGISVRTLKRRIAAGDITPVRIGRCARIRRADIDAITGRSNT